jgi:hypothetical protein
VHISRDLCMQEPRPSRIIRGRYCSFLDAPPGLARVETEHGSVNSTLARQLLLQAENRHNVLLEYVNHNR